MHIMFTDKCYHEAKIGYHDIWYLDSNQLKFKSNQKWEESNEKKPIVKFELTATLPSEKKNNKKNPIK